MPIVRKQFLMPVMRKPEKISYPTFTRNLQPYNHYRKTLDCDCSNGQIVEIFKDSCCPTPIKSGSTVLSKEYYPTRESYMYARCQTYRQKSTIVNEDGEYKSTCTQACPVVYKPSNAKFQVQGAVSSSSRLDRLKYNTLASRGKYRPGYINTELKQGGTQCKYRKNGDKSRCD